MPKDTWHTDLIYRHFRKSELTFRGVTFQIGIRIHGAVPHQRYVAYQFGTRFGPTDIRTVGFLKMRKHYGKENRRGT
jgi:hypothetical protein